MKITVIGWYGTETIGDRAILAGLISYFNKSFSHYSIKLGSLNPFFSTRTINEDENLYNKITAKNIDIEVFDSKSHKQLDDAIKNSDLLVMGGGPLMDLKELLFVEYAFIKAKKQGISTAILGCGVGPLYSKKYRKSVLNIANKADLIILRDKKSKENLIDIYNEFDSDISKKEISVSFDPAVECTHMYLTYTKDKIITNKKVLDDYICINLRKFPEEYREGTTARDINSALLRFVKDIANNYKNENIYLIPMHYFHIGDDDRLFLNKLQRVIGTENVTVQNAPLSLEETIEKYKNAKLNVGMRFHSVVLQTICSGKNLVLDYTQPNKGKIKGFIDDIDNISFYKNRYLNLQNEEPTFEFFDDVDESQCFNYSEDSISRASETYVNGLSQLIK
ncbi:polysaccharide pyruvyl transferase family protein [Vibrio artabrorum]|uniref:polysaccharide pyruvyl transferase family protein n=1 Tax=Vibrio artabrorum TaxID=446374 RepID=UPI00354B7FD3